MSTEHFMSENTQFSALILSRQHRHTFGNYTYIQLSLCLYFCLLYLLLNICDGNDAKHNSFSSVGCWWLWKEPVPLKSASFILANVQSDVFFTFTHAHNRFLYWPTTSLMTFCNMLPIISMRRYFKPPMSHHFHRSYLKENMVSKSEGTRKVEYAHNFLKVCWCCLPKIIKISPCLTKIKLTKVGSFFELQCIMTHGSFLSISAGIDPKFT